MEDRVVTFAERLTAVGGTVHLVHPGELPDEVARLVESGTAVVLTSDASWLALEMEEAGVETVVLRADAGRPAPVGPESSRSAAHARVGITTCLAGVAATGTVVVGSDGAGGGLVSCLPERHIAVLRERDIVDTLAEAVSLVGDRGDLRAGGVVFVTGPSRTADIEMTSVLGAHGPLALDVFVVRDSR